MCTHSGKPATLRMVSRSQAEEQTLKDSLSSDCSSQTCPVSTETVMHFTSCDFTSCPHREHPGGGCHALVTGVFSGSELLFGEGRQAGGRER